MFRNQYHKSKMSMIKNERTGDISCQTDSSRFLDIEYMCNAKSRPLLLADQVRQGLILRSISNKRFEYLKHSKAKEEEEEDQLINSKHNSGHFFMQL